MIPVPGEGAQSTRQVLSGTQKRSSSTQPERGEQTAQPGRQEGLGKGSGPRHLRGIARAWGGGWGALTLVFLSAWCFSPLSQHSP